MSISGLMITLDDDPTRADSALASLAADSRLELGPRQGPRLAAVADTPSTRDDRALFDALNEQPGIRRVDVVYVGVEPPSDQPSATATSDQEPQP